MAVSTRKSAESSSCNGAEPLKPEPSIPYSHKLFFAMSAIYWSIITALLIPSLCIAFYYLLLLPISLISHSLYLAIERKLARFTNEHWVAAFHWYGIGVVEYGDNLENVSEERSVVMVNHLGLLDHFILMASMHEKGSITERWLWLIFHIWQWTPMGFAWSLHNNYFINGGRDKRAKQLDDFRTHLRSCYWRDNHSFMVVYPEGSRLFLIKESNQKFARQTGAPELKHTALPRMGAISAMLQECGPRSHRNGIACHPSHCPSTCHSPVKYIIDATLGYPNEFVAGLDQVIGGEVPTATRPYTVSVHYRVLNVSDIPDIHDEAQLRNWLYERWMEKDRLLDDFYRTGAFPGPGRRIDFNIWRTLFVECFWFAMWYLHWRIWIRLFLSTIANFLF